MTTLTRTTTTKFYRVFQEIGMIILFALRQNNTTQRFLKESSIYLADANKKVWLVLLSKLCRFLAFTFLTLYEWMKRKLLIYFLLFYRVKSKTVIRPCFSNVMNIFCCLKCSYNFTLMVLVVGWKETNFFIYFPSSISCWYSLIKNTIEVFSSITHDKYIKI